jgi:Protein of unknown function (DUF2997)
MTRPRLVVTVDPEGRVSAETVDILGEKCLDWIAVLEDLLAAKVTDSAFTADYQRQPQSTQEQQVNRDVDPA